MELLPAVYRKTILKNIVVFFFFFNLEVTLKNLKLDRQAAYMSLLMCCA